MTYVSVIVPIYNLEKYLPRCLNSLISQDFRDYEIILVDDGSSDGSGKLCERYVSHFPNIIKCIHKNNGGLSSARNAGILSAKGNYVIFPDPDDWVEDYYLSKLVILQKKYLADLVCTGYSVDLDDYREIVGLNEPTIIMDNKGAKESLIIPPCMNGFAWNKLFRLDIIKKNKLWFLDDVGTTEDLDFAYRYLAFCNTIVFAPSITSYHYYQREGAATRSRFSKRMVDSIHTYEKIIDNEKENMRLTNAAKVEICNISLNSLLAYFSSGENNRELFQMLDRYFHENVRYYLFDKKYNTGRKIQAMLAWISPELLWYCKKIMGKQ